MIRYLVLALIATLARAAESPAQKTFTQFAEKYCFKCHDSSTQKGDREFESFKLPLATEAAIRGASEKFGKFDIVFANAGIAVDLLDIVPAGAANRNQVAEAALQRLQRNEPAAFMSAGAARLVRIGNIEDHLERLRDVDWIVEAALASRKRVVGDPPDAHRFAVHRPWG